MNPTFKNKGKIRRAERDAVSGSAVRALIITECYRLILPLKKKVALIDNQIFFLSPCKFSEKMRGPDLV